MSDELETVAKVGGSVVITTPLVVWFVKRFVKRSDLVEAQASADLRALVAELRGDVKQLSERQNSALANHADRIGKAELRIENIDTRLGVREGRYGDEPITNPGSKPSAAVQALRDAHRAKAKSDE